jgi:hypothetical protein
MIHGRVETYLSDLTGDETIMSDSEIPYAGQERLFAARGLLDGPASN